MAVNVGSLYWSAGIRTKALVNDAKTIKNQFRGLGKAGNNLGNVFSPKNLGIAGIATALGAAGKAAYDFSKEYETAFASVRTITNESEEGISNMEQSIIDMTQAIPIGAKEGAEALYQIVSAGYDGAEGLNLLEVSARAAVGGITDTATAADGITTILNAYGKEANEASKVSDVLFSTVRLGKTTFGELAASISNIAPLAASSNISFEEISGAIATLTKQGVPTAQAITQIRSAVLATTEVLGDAAFNGRTLQEAFVAVRESASGSNSALRESLGRVEALNAVLGLTGDNAKTAASDLEGIAASTGAAADAFEVMVNTADSQLKLLQNNIKAVMKSVGDAILVSTSGVVKEINKLFEDPVKLTKDLKVSGVTQEINKLEKATDKAKLAQEQINKLYDEAAELSKKQFKEADEGSITFSKRLSDVGDKIKDVSSFGDVFDLFLEVPTDNKQEKLLKDLNTYEDTIKGIYLAIADLEKLEFTDKKDDGGGGGEIPIKFKTVGDLKTELKALQDKLDTVPISEAPSITAKIEIKKKEIEEAITGIEKIEIEPIVTVKPKEAKLEDGGSKILDKIKELEEQKKITGTLAETEVIQKKINALQKEYNKLIGATNLKLTDSSKDLSKLAKGGTQTADTFGMMAEGLGGVTYALDSAASFASNFDEELAGTITTIANVTDAAAGIAIGIASGNPFQIIGSAFDLLSSNIVSSAELQAQAQENLANRITRANRLIQDQIDLLSEMSGDEVTQGRVEALDAMQDQLNELNDEASNLTANFKKVEKGGFLGLGKKTTNYNIGGFEDIADLKEFYESGGVDKVLSKGFTFKNESEILDLIDEYEQLVETRKELFESFIGTNAGDIADTITQGFAAGKYAVEDFAEDFENLMRDALLQTFKDRAIIAKAGEFFDAFAEEFSDGDVSASDIEKLQKDFDKIIEDAQKEFDGLNQIFESVFGSGLADSVDESVDSLAGAVGRSITEDTGTELVGLWTRTSFDTRAILEANNMMVDIQQQIAVNTLRVAEGVDLINSRNESQSTDRDSGNVI